CSSDLGTKLRGGGLEGIGFAAGDGDRGAALRQAGGNRQPDAAAGAGDQGAAAGQVKGIGLRTHGRASTIPASTRISILPLPLESRLFVSRPIGDRPRNDGLSGSVYQRVTVRVTFLLPLRAVKRRLSKMPSPLASRSAIT